MASPGESVTFTEGDVSTPPDLRFIHYNDVYNVEAGSSDPVGGIPRFQTLFKHYRNDDQFIGQPDLLTLFSGDAFNPSLESSVTKGAHMVPVLNKLGTDVACVGNHDLDFGVKQFRNLSSQCDFPWLLANVLDPALGDDVPLANARKTLMLTASNGIKVGVIGLVEREWLATINALPPNLVYKSVSATANELAPELRKQGAQMVIALTHQREPNDNKLAQKALEAAVDLVLGGHDHYYSHSFINGVHVLRSGTDFKQLSYIEARKGTDGSSKWNFHIVRRDVVKSIARDPEMVKLEEKLSSALKAKLEKPLGYTTAALDARFTTVRLKESNLGNFVCDIMRLHYQGDCALMASGTIRGDQIYPPGLLKIKDIMTCFPFNDPVIVIMVTGKALRAALENSVSMYPALEGRFPQVSNISFEFDPQLPCNSRVLWAKVGGSPIEDEKPYKLVTRGYMGRGKDGFDSLLVKSEGGKCEEIVEEENGILISMLLRQYFMSLKILGKWRHWSNSLHRHWDGVHKDLHDIHTVVPPKAPPSSERVKSFSEQRKKLPHKRKRSQGNIESMVVESDSEADHSEADQDIKFTDQELQLVRMVMRKWWRLAGLHRKGNPKVCDNQEEFSIDWTRVSTLSWTAAYVTDSLPRLSHPAWKDVSI
jgi:5'-nucleotidase